MDSRDGCKLNLTPSTVRKQMKQTLECVCLYICSYMPIISIYYYFFYFFNYYFFGIWPPVVFRGTAAYVLLACGVYKCWGICVNFFSHLLHFSGGLRGASIIDSLDTLYIMGLMDEYNDAKEWVKTSLDLNSVRKIFIFPSYLQYYCLLV